MRSSDPYPRRTEARGPSAVRGVKAPPGWLEWLRLWWEGLD
jgi:hypothetical protein